jgi:hypothetical protein
MIKIAGLRDAEFIGSNLREIEQKEIELIDGHRDYVKAVVDSYKNSLAYLKSEKNGEILGAAGIIEEKSLMGVGRFWCWFTPTKFLNESNKLTFVKDYIVMLKIFKKVFKTEIFFWYAWAEHELNNRFMKIYGAQILGTQYNKKGIPIYWGVV